jgi:sec-independent protein translocase protein TatA
LTNTEIDWSLNMLGLDNPIHILFLLMLLLLVFGAKRLPEIGRSLGTGMRGFKETLSGEAHHQELAPPPQNGAFPGEQAKTAPAPEQRS